MSISTPLNIVIVWEVLLPTCVCQHPAQGHICMCLNSVTMRLNSAASVSMLLCYLFVQRFTMTFLVLLLMMMVLLQMSLSVHSGRMKSITKDVCNILRWKIAKDVCSTIDHIILKSWSHQVKKNLKKGTFVVVRKMSCSF